MFALTHARNVGDFQLDGTWILDLAYMEFVLMAPAIGYRDSK
jgi:hypothetical protein